MKVAPRFGSGHRILVTGGAGFVPSHLVDRLIERGCTVVVLDNFVTGSKDNIAHLLEKPTFTLIEADISEGLPTDHPAMAERFDGILHMASPASPTDFEKLPVEILRVGSVATLHLLERATADGARFLMASTSEAYGDPKEHPQRETYWGNVNPIGIRSVYDEAKRFSEAATMAYHRSRGTDTAIVRAARRADHRARHRRPDPVDLLRRRPGAGHPAAARLDRERSDQLRHRARDVDAATGRDDRVTDRKQLRGELHHPRRRRSGDAASRSDARP
ncbi:hypothetical protein GCM10027452_13700 [Micromonospora halotolerans]